MVAQIAALGGQVTVDTETHLLTVNHEFTVSLVLARCQVTPGGAYRWVIRFESVLRPDITVAVRMDGTNMQPLDYYLFPALAMVDPRCRLAESNGFFFDAFRYDSLDALFRLTERIHLKEMLYGTPDYL
ncbi:MAG: hypothetical protein BWY76_02703 [bacterium ADurb.Bin429]|nr:MAG: hypothetical protein BWY76_02703 [bacterium ADurb.Bin429]